MDASVSIPDDQREDTPNPNKLLKEYLLQNEPIFATLTALKDKGWANREGDEHFKTQRERADKADHRAQQNLYKMMQQIADELHSQTQVFALPTNPTLDLCMAPGGYSSGVLKHNPAAQIRGTSLPRALGGHNMLLKNGFRNSDIQCRFLDITMLASEFGADAIPRSHPERTSFMTDRPYLGTQFQLIFCDGQVLRTHQRSPHREHFEAVRLTTSQLILALQRIAPGGTMVMLLHKPDTWDSAQLLFQFSQFADIQLFKPKKKHATRGSFYLVAKNVQPSHDSAQAALSAWKAAWWHATFGGENGTGEERVVQTATVETLIREFGSKLIELARPVWDIQREALANASFVTAGAST